MLALDVGFVEARMPAALAKSFRRHHHAYNRNERLIIHVIPKKFETRTSFSRRCSGTLFNNRFRSIGVLLFVASFLFAIFAVRIETTGHSTVPHLSCFQSEPRMMFPLAARFALPLIGSRSLGFRRHRRTPREVGQPTTQYPRQASPRSFRECARNLADS